jgi:hypothetical protein
MQGHQGVSGRFEPGLLAWKKSPTAIRFYVGLKIQTGGDGVAITTGRDGVIRSSAESQPGC